jgi:hypothetical protein
MRKTLIICLLIITGVLGVRGQQVELKGGIKFNTIHYNYAEVDAKSNIGFMLGADLIYPLSENFKFTTGLLFNQKGKATDNARIRLYYADIPVKLGFNKEIFYNVFMTFNVGGYFGMGLFGKHVQMDGAKTSTDIKWGNTGTMQDIKDFRRFDYGLLAEAKFIFNEKFGFNLGYELGLANMIPQLYYLSDNNHGYNRSLYLGLIYVIKSK